MRRMKVLKLNGELLRSMLIQDGTRAVKIEGFPKDGQMTGAYYDICADRYIIRVESNEFPEVPEHFNLEELVLTVTDMEVGTAHALQDILYKLDEFGPNIVAEVRDIAIRALKAANRYAEPSKPMREFL